MRHLDEYRDAVGARRISDAIRRLVEPRGGAASARLSIMEVCGGQTHAIVRSGIDRLLPPAIRMIHGPGCPVCVTPLGTIDRAIAIASLPGAILCSYGDMLRVPGSRESLLAVRARGGDVRVVYSPLDAVAIARGEPGREVVFLAIGFETTAPANAMAVKVARGEGLRNFSMLVSQARVPAAIDAIQSGPQTRVDAFLAAGHVCSVMGTGEYPAVAARHRVPIVVTGFEPLDILDGIRRAVVQVVEGRAEVENAYGRVVRHGGNEAARAVIAEVFESVDREWRGIGTIPASGWRLAAAYRGFDAENRFDLPGMSCEEPTECRSGEVLRGLLSPPDCPAFGVRCTPRTPLGATMVSGEGACAAHYHARRVGSEAAP